MKNICKDCIYCNNYQVSELGCFGQAKACEFYAGEDDRTSILIKQDFKEKLEKII